MLDSWSLPVLQDPCTITVQFKDSLVPIFCWLFADGFLFVQGPKREDIWLARHLAARWNLLQTFLTAQETSENSWISAPIDRESLCPAIQRKQRNINKSTARGKHDYLLCPQVSKCMHDYWKTRAVSYRRHYDHCNETGCCVIRCRIWKWKYLFRRLSETCWWWALSNLPWLTNASCLWDLLILSKH